MKGPNLTYGSSFFGFWFIRSNHIDVKGKELTQFVIYSTGFAYLEVSNGFFIQIQQFRKFNYVKTSDGSCIGHKF